MTTLPQENTELTGDAMRGARASVVLDHAKDLKRIGTIGDQHLVLGLFLSTHNKIGINFGSFDMSTNANGTIDERDTKR